LAEAVNSQQWDPSVKALTQFPSVLDNMNENLSWTSALGDAYVNAPDEVMNAVQVLRQRAQTAGKLETTSEQVVTAQDQTIAIAPTNPDVVYVPAYDPWLVYGAPLAAYPGWVPVSGVFFGGPDLYFGAGFALGVFAAFDWGWQDWGFDWHRHAMLYHHSPYFSHSPTFAFRHGSPGGRSSFDQSAHGSFDHAGLNRPGASLGHAPFDRPGGPAENVPVTRAGDFRGPGPSATTSFPRPSQFHDESSFRPGAFSGFDHGGTVAAYSARGRSSFSAPVRMGSFASRGMGGASHAFAGGIHGGGGHR
jgi:hypothetical protein